MREDESEKAFVAQVHKELRGAISLDYFENKHTMKEIATSKPTYLTDVICTFGKSFDAKKTKATQQQ